MNRVLLSLLLFVLCLTSASAQIGKQDSVRSMNGVADTIHARTVEVSTHRTPGFVLTPMQDVEAGVIFAGKKTELVRLEDITVNLATNNTRQILQSVAGLNIWESDAAGIQLGIGGRGLSPNRSSNFTVRQNGYDISADPLGYPESYYTPPAEALDRIEIVRGAGSLRYGTQFGGMVNFVMKEGGHGNPIEATTSLTGGSFGFASAFARLGGTVEKTTYTALYQYKKADGWRPNSEFDMHTAYVAARFPITDCILLRADYTFMSYLAHQPGGLSDAMFATDPSQSVRARNWFNVNWNVVSLTADVICNNSISVRTQFFGNFSSRNALGNLNRITMVDLGGPRTLIAGTFNNLGLESSITYEHSIGELSNTLVAGIRLFSGVTSQDQGDASTASDADFRFTNPEDLEGSSYTFPNKNAAAFAEYLIRVSKTFSVTPGARLEYISTNADGWYRNSLKDLAGNIITDTVIYENRSRDRTIGLLGIGLQYNLSEQLSVYSNASQNYRSITFSDLRISNPNLKIDTAIQDERGYTLDVGIRGPLTEFLHVNASAFYLRYNDKIGEVLKDGNAPLYLPYRYRTNVSDAYTTGVEFVTDLGFREAFAMANTLPNIHLLVNATFLDGRYINTQNSSIANKKVELVPSYIVRTSLSAAFESFTASVMWSAVGEQFTDATNAVFSPTAVNGIIPSYNVLDLSVRYTSTHFDVEGSVNNLLGVSYFTRRADSYPGPGIIPAEPLSFYLTLRGKF